MSGLALASERSARSSGMDTTKASRFNTGRSLRSSVTAIVALMMVTAAAAEPCDPALYGRLCDTEMRKPGNKGRAPVRMPSVQSIGSDHLVRQEQERPATFGAITFQGGKQCIGLLRRANCN